MIACAADAEKLAADLSGRMSALRSELYDDATSALRAEIDEICGRLEDRSVWRSDESVVYTRSHSVEREVKENAERTIAEYTRLVEADYTVCDRDKALVAIEYAKRVLAEHGDDAADRDALRALIDEAGEYSRRDGELRKHYDDYLDLRGMLEERGELTENLSEFDVFDHETQRNKMIETLNKMTGFQSVLTTHNTDLMSNKLTRPDCCFVMTKGKITALCDATDRELREGHNLEKLYKSGEFDAD